jgi:hypothetical protein
VHWDRSLRCGAKRSHVARDFDRARDLVNRGYH